MAKKMICKPAPELEIEFDGGESVLLRFDVLSIGELQELGDFKDLLAKGMPEIAAAIIYASGKNHNDNFDYDKARYIVSNMSIENINDIINEFTEGIGITATSEQKELSKNLMAQFLQTLQ